MSKDDMWPVPSLAVIMELNVSKIQIEYGGCGSHQVKARVVIDKDELRDTLKKLFKDTDAIGRFINE